MKKGYIATNNMRCKSLTYEVGKEYIINTNKSGSYEFHYCKNLEDTLRFHDYKKDETVFLEIEDLDSDSETNRVEIATKHIKVLRVVPKRSYLRNTNLMNGET